MILTAIATWLWLATPAAFAEPEIPFDDALNKIVERSTAVGIQQAALKSTEAHNLPTRLAFLPTLTFDAKRSAVQSFGADQVPTKQIEGVAQLNLFRFGADLAAIRAVSNDDDRQRALLDNSVLAAEDLGVRLLTTEILNAQGVKVRQDILETQSQSYNIAHQRYDHGVLPLQEVEKISIDLDNAKSRLTDAQIQEYESHATLTSALGSSQIQLEWPWKSRMEKFRPRNSAASDSDIVQILAKRPDWRAAQISVQAETERLSQTRRQVLPTVDGSFAYGYYNTADQGGPSWSGTLSLTVPLFDRLYNYSNAKAQSYTRNSAEFSFEQTQRDARADWEAARNSFSLALTSALNREKTLTTARKLYQDNLKRFQSGRIDANDLALDQNRLYDSEFLAIQGWSSAHLAFVRFCHAEGFKVTECSGNP